MKGVETKFEYYIQRAKRFGYKTCFGQTEKGVDCLLVLRENYRTLDAYIMDDGIIVPAGSLDYEDDGMPAFVYVSEIKVEDKFQNRGIGKFMMEKFMDLARHNGCSQIQLVSLKSARGFYKKLGFKVDEVNRAGFANCVIDVSADVILV